MRTKDFQIKKTIDELKVGDIFMMWSPCNNRMCWFKKGDDGCYTWHEPLNYQDTTPYGTHHSNPTNIDHNSVVYVSER